MTYTSRFRRAGVPARSLFSASPMFDSVEIVTAPVVLTHFCEYDRIQKSGDSIALCGAWTGKWNLSADPTCPQCRAKLALTADDVFGKEGE